MVCQKVENDAMFHQLVANSFFGAQFCKAYKAQIFAKKFDIV